MLPRFLIWIQWCGCAWDTNVGVANGMNDGDYFCLPFIVLTYRLWVTLCFFEHFILIDISIVVFYFYWARIKIEGLLVSPQGLWSWDHINHTWEYIFFLINFSLIQGNSNLSALRIEPGILIRRTVYMTAMPQLRLTYWRYTTIPDAWFLLYILPYQSPQIFAIYLVEGYDLLYLYNITLTSIGHRNNIIGALCTLKYSMLWQMCGGWRMGSWKKW